MDDIVERHVGDVGTLLKEITEGLFLKKPLCPGTGEVLLLLQGSHQAKDATLHGDNFCNLLKNINSARHSLATYVSTTKTTCIAPWYDL
jgi:hypothetical protein